MSLKGQAPPCLDLGGVDMRNTIQGKVLLGCFVSGESFRDREEPRSIPCLALILLQH